MMYEKKWIFQDAITTVGNGEIFYVNRCDTITVEIYGTNVDTVTVLFEGQATSGAYYSIRGIRLSDYSIANQSITVGELWSFDTTGIIAIRMKVSALTGAGAILNVVGKAVISNG